MVAHRIHDLNPDVILIDLRTGDAGQGLRTIELLHDTCSKSAIFAIGDMGQPQVIVDSMRAGAKEFFPRPTTTEHLLDALNRLLASRRKLRSPGTKGHIFAVMNAKGGSGATTIAVNTAMATALARGSTAVVDMAPLGNVSLHLNLKPAFSILDALNNLHRLDVTLLDGFMTRHQTGLHLLAGHPTINSLSVGPADYARLFDTVVAQYRHVIVDLSTRLDGMAKAICDLSDTVLLVANPEFASLWSAARIHEFFAGSTAEQKLKLVLNRHRKMAGYSDSEIEDITKIPIASRIPNNYAAVLGSIERGIPIAQQNHSDTARCFVDLSNSLTGEQQSKGRPWLFRTA